MKKKTILFFAVFLILAVSQCKKLGMDDYDRPSVADYFPKENSVVPRDVVVTVSFSESMDTQMVESSFSLAAEGGGTVALRTSWSDNNRKMTCTPLKLLEPNQKYTAMISRSAEDSKGNDLNRDYKFSFNVIGLASDRPKFISSSPNHMDVGVAKDALITLIFSKPINRNSIETGIIISPSLDYTPAWFDGDTRVVLTPLKPMDGPKSYSISLNQAIQDINGNKLYEDISFTFTVGSDFIKPSLSKLTVSGFSVFDPAVPVDWELSTYSFDDQLTLMPVISLSFNKDMNQVLFASLFAPSFPVPCTINWMTSQQVEITPSIPLTHGSIYTVALSKDYKDVNGNPLLRDYSYKIRMGLDLTPLKIIDLKVIDPGYPDQDLFNDPDKEMIIPGNKANQCSLKIVFNHSVDTGSFESNFSVSSISSKSFQWSQTNVPNDTVVVSFGENLKWHGRYTISFNENIKSKSQNSMSRVDYYMIIGEDYNKPLITSVAAAGGTEAPAVVALFVNMTAQKVEKKDYFMIDFNEEMNLDSLNSGIYLKNASNNQKTELFVMADIAVPKRYLFFPKSNLESDARYRLVVSNKAADLQGNIIDNLGFESEIYYDFIVDAENSSYVKVVENAPPSSPLLSKVWKRPWNSGTSDFDPWDVMVNMEGTLKIQMTPSSQIKDWLLISFNKKLDAHSVYGKISFVALMGGTYATVSIPIDQIIVNTSFDETSGTSILIKNMTLTEGSLCSIYILKIMGGADGVKDIYGNIMKETFEYWIKINT